MAHILVEYIDGKRVETTVPYTPAHPRKPKAKAEEIADYRIEKLARQLCLGVDKKEINETWDKRPTEKEWRAARKIADSRSDADIPS